MSLVCFSQPQHLEHPVYEAAIPQHEHECMFITPITIFPTYHDCLLHIPDGNTLERSSKEIFPMCGMTDICSACDDSPGICELITKIRFNHYTMTILVLSLNLLCGECRRLHVTRAQITPRMENVLTMYCTSNRVYLLFHITFYYKYKSLLGYLLLVKVHGMHVTEYLLV